MNSSEPAQLPLLDELIEMIGAPATLQLCLKRGGETVYIPASVPHGHWLVEILGADAANALAWVYSGNKITVPLGPSSTNRQRIKKLRELIESGASVNTIVRHLRVARRTVYRHKVSARQGKNNGQLKLF